MDTSICSAVHVNQNEQSLVYYSVATAKTHELARKKKAKSLLFQVWIKFLTTYGTYHTWLNKIKTKVKQYNFHSKWEELFSMNQCKNMTLKKLNCQNMCHLGLFQIKIKISWSTQVLLCFPVCAFTFVIQKQVMEWKFCIFLTSRLYFDLTFLKMCHISQNNHNLIKMLIRNAS